MAHGQPGGRVRLDVWNRLSEKISRLQHEVDAASAALAPCLLRAETAEKNYNWMVEHAADEKLDGYRELGQRAADAEERAEKAEGEVISLKSAVQTLLSTLRVLGHNVTLNDSVIEMLDREKVKR